MMLLLNSGQKPKYYFQALIISAGEGVGKIRVKIFIVNQRFTKER